MDEHKSVSVQFFASDIYNYRSIGTSDGEFCGGGTPTVIFFDVIPLACRSTKFDGLEHAATFKNIVVEGFKIHANRNKLQRGAVAESIVANVDQAVG